MPKKPLITSGTIATFYACEGSNPNPCEVIKDPWVEGDKENPERSLMIEVCGHRRIVSRSFVFTDDEWKARFLQDFLGVGFSTAELDARAGTLDAFVSSMKGEKS